MIAFAAVEAFSSWALSVPYSGLRSVDSYPALASATNSFVVMEDFTATSHASSTSNRSIVYLKNPS